MRSGIYNCHAYISLQVDIAQSSIHDVSSLCDMIYVKAEQNCRASFFPSPQQIAVFYVFLLALVEIVRVINSSRENDRYYPSTRKRRGT